MNIEEAIKQGKPMLPMQKAMVNLIYTYHWYVEKAGCLFKSSGITMQQYNVLRVLRGKQGAAIPVGEVKAVLLDRNPDLTRLCDRLEEKGWIQRETNDDNRRQVLIKITETGLEQLGKIDPYMDDFTQKWANLSETEALQLSDLLDKLRG